MDLAQLRQRYADAGLSEQDLAADPIEQFRRWFAAWREVAVGDPNAMVVATATPGGRPSLRMVLLKGVRGDTFVFFTNYESRKGRELAANPHVVALFPWHPLGRQVIVEGRAARLDAEGSDAYWASRPWASRISALASPQSTVIENRSVLERRVAALAARHPEGSDVPRPADWGGVGVVADGIEFWQGRENRLHDRLVYRRDTSAPSGWRIERLAP